MKKFKFISFLFSMLMSFGVLFSCTGEPGPVGAQGPQGVQGQPGKDGVDGEDGHTPVITIGENGNWFIDGVDTGVKAQGDKGDTGAQGEKGDKGDKGDTGAQGAQGDKGDTGAPGADGKDGTSLLTGDGIPSNDIGINGDSYVDLSSWDFYIKVNGEWILKGNIRSDSAIHNTEGLVFTPISDTECSVSIGKGEERFLKEIYIPSTYEDYVVTKIEDGADIHTGKIIGGFAGLSCLEKVYIPNTINYIGIGAFAFCNNLKEVVIEEGISIDSLNNAFTYCYNLSHFEIPEGVTKLNDVEFAGCNLSSLIIPTSIESVGYLSIDSYQIYRSIYYKGTIEDWLSIEFHPEFLNNINILTSLYLLNEDSEWELLNELVIPDNIIEANLSSFSYFYSVSDIELHKDVKTICSKVNQFRNVYYNGTLENWLNVETSTQLGSNLYLLDDNGDVEHNGKKYSLFNPTELVIPDGVTSIAESAFANMTSLKKVTIPSTITTIGYGAFRGCDSLEEITIPFVGQKEYDSEATHFGYIFGASSYAYNEVYVPSSLKEVVITGGIDITDYAFSGCSSLTSIEIPNTVRTIGNAAFSECRNLASIEIPNSVTSIFNRAFSGCSSLENIYYNGTLADWCKINFEDEYSNPMYAAKNANLYFLDENGDVEYNGNKYTLQTSLLEITSEITEIKQYAFYGCNIQEIYYDGFESDFLNIIYNGYLGNVFDNSSNITVHTLNTIEQVRSERYSNKLYNIKGIVVENYSVGYVVYDGTGFITVYLNGASPFEIGEYINIKGYISFYAGNPQFTSKAVVSILDEPVPDYINIDNLPDLTIDEEYISNVIEDWKNNYRHPGGVYGTIEATLTKDVYYSLTVGGSTVSLSPFNPTQEDAELYNQYLGKKVYCEVVLMHVIHEKAIQVVVLSMNLVDEG